MSITSGKTLVLRLFERQSAKGNQYWTGRLGAAKVVAFPNTKIELQFGAVGAIDVFVQHWKRPLAEESAEELAEEPPLDDDVSGLWRDP